MVSNWTRICDRLRGPPCGWRRAQAGHGRPRAVRRTRDGPWCTTLADHSGRGGGRGRRDRHAARPADHDELIRSFLPKSYESIRAANLQDKAFPQAGHVTASAAIIVFSGPAIISGLVLAVLAIGAFVTSRPSTCPRRASPALPNHRPC